jgi:hypothetical protein
LPALLEAIAVAVHFEDVDVVRRPVEQRARQPLGPEHAGPLVERQVGRHDGGAASITLAEDLEQELGAGRSSAILPGFRRYRYVSSIRFIRAAAKLLPSLA